MKKICSLTGLILFGAAAALLLAARKVSGFAEWYSCTIYPLLVGSMGRIFGWIPVSVVELGLYAMGVLLLFLLLRYWRKPLFLLQVYGSTAALLLFLYAACCGVNYYRIPFSSYFIHASSAGKVSVDDSALENLCVWLTEKVNEAWEELEQTEEPYGDMPRKGIAAMKGLAASYPCLDGYYPRPKPVMISWILSVQQCSGVYSPFTVEANYNNDMISYNIPHTICHEMSHLRGFMREDEANFIGYLACLGSEDEDFRYSGYLLGWIYAGNALAKSNYDAYVRLYGMLREEIQEDLDANSRFWEQYEGTAAQVQETINDAYLKANGQPEGVKTYGRVVDLMLLDFWQNRQE